MHKILRKATLLVVSTLTLTGMLAPVATPQLEAQAKATKVIIAPKHGKKYHYARGCRGLNHASKTKKVTLKWAKQNHYKLCGWEK
ncbi:hypothetical protein [Levilactobacillus acidifarinae]|uniref:Uncharacterized protein n=1 Tax=Levilactobacillus acidifarinae DSM 19394 = JCM 15949 TaxID=1423715 RepID=A0A0R1LFQ8_9LACO|nr:hypothetical protein [Levilactobacillus acidifarinae]KRK94699.1 hypothetical protein FD25_GL000671 [Levilactobacillus acidifarinae DSM 19394]GEO68453.1 hypothetical protein LAC03_03630 [Levilactobacillus acidifarinae]